MNRRTATNLRPGHRAGSESHLADGIGNVVRAALAAACVAAAVYAGAWRGGPVWDDGIIVHDIVPLLSSGSRILFPPSDVVLLDRYYRPLVYATYATDYYLAGGGAFARHATGIFGHAVCAALVAWLAWQVQPAGRRDPLVALFAGTLFAVHPIHVESVAWMSGRADILAALALLVMFWNLLRFDWGAGALAAVSFFLALCSKESAVCGLALAALALARRPDRRIVAPRLLMLSGALVLYGVLRWNALGGWVSPEQPIAAQTDAALRALYALLFELRALVWPFPANPFVPDIPVPDVASWLVLIVAVSALGLFAWRVARGGDSLPLVGLSWLGIGLLPNLVVATHEVATVAIAERYEYIPSIGLCWVFGSLVGSARTLGGWRARFSTAIAVVLVLVGGCVTITRVGIWHDNRSFWTAAARSAPGHCLPLTQLADDDLLEGRAATAEQQYRIALAGKCPPKTRAYVLGRLGLTAYQQNRLTEAEANFSAARQFDPGDFFAPYGLGLCAATNANAEIRAGRDASELLTQAVHQLQAAVALRSRFADAHYLLGEVLNVRGDGDRARVEWQTAVQVDPTSPAAKQARAALASESE